MGTLFIRRIDLPRFDVAVSAGVAGQRVEMRAEQVATEWGRVHRRSLQRGRIAKRAVWLSSSLAFGLQIGKPIH